MADGGEREEKEEDSTGEVHSPGESNRIQDDDEAG